MPSHLYDDKCRILASSDILFCGPCKRSTWHMKKYNETEWKCQECAERKRKEAEKQKGAGI